METNYVPVIKRTRLARSGFRRQSVVRGQIDFGGLRTVLTDVAFYALNSGTLTLPAAMANVRIGKWGSEILTEAFYPLALFGTKPRQEFGVWEFAKPYRIYPGERLSAAVEYMTVPQQRATPRAANVPAIQFNGVRVLDNRPILLHDNFDVRMVGPASTRLIAEKLQCPADSPVDIYSCVGQPTDSTIVGTNGDRDAMQRFMVYGPDGRQWWDDHKWPFLFNPPGFIMDLNKPEWILKENESFFCEFVTIEDPLNNHTSDCDLCITLRGQVEVSK
jgi:hypothetical protein